MNFFSNFLKKLMIFFNYLQIFDKKILLDI